jgi:hypothetical protein
MTPIIISTSVFGVVFGGVLIGIFLGAVLPKHHLSDDTKDTIKAAQSVVAGVAALTLGLLVASAKASYDMKASEIRSSASKIILLDRTLAKYGPQANEIRELLRQALDSGIHRVWSTKSHAIGKEQLSKSPGADAVQVKLLNLSPENDSQTWLKNSALQLSNEIAGSRWLFFSATDSSIQWPFVAVLVFWLFSIFASFGLFAPRNVSTFAALFIAAMSVTGAIYLTLELDMPYRGLIQISSAPLRMALDQIGPGK